MRNIFFGKNILHLRQRDNQTLEEFGNRFNLSTSQISYYERGDGFAPIKVAIKMCDEFNCGLDDLFLRDMRPNAPKSPDGGDKPRGRIRKGNAPPQYAGHSGGGLVLAATESPPALMERDDGLKRRPPESPPPKETEIVNDVGKGREKEEIPIIRQQLIDMMQRLQQLENAA